MNQIYTIKSIDNNGIILEEYTKISIYNTRFRLATPEEIEYYNFPNKLNKLLDN